MNIYDLPLVLKSDDGRQEYITKENFMNANSFISLMITEKSYKERKKAKIYEKFGIDSLLHG